MRDRRDVGKTTPTTRVRGFICTIKIENEGWVTENGIDGLDCTGVLDAIFRLAC